MTDQISEDRQLAIRILTGKGWTYRRSGKNHEFSRHDTGDLWDFAQISHNNLSSGWALGICERYEADLAELIEATRRKWLRDNFPERNQP